MFRGLFFIVFIVNLRTSSCIFEALYEAGQQVWELYTIIDNGKSDYMYDAEYITYDPIIRETEKRVDAIHETLKQLEKFMGPKKIVDTIRSWPLDIRTIREIDTIELYVQSIDRRFEEVNRYSNDSNGSYDSFMGPTEYIFRTVQGDMEIIRKLAINEEKSLLKKTNLVATIADCTAVHGTAICGSPHVISDIFVQLFRMIVIAELKTSTMLAHENAYEYVKNEDKRVWQDMNSLARENLEKQVATYVTMFLSKMAVIDGIYNRACDPPGGNWVRDESFYELEKTFQAILFGYKQSNCESQSCNYIWFEKPRQCRPVFHEEPILRSPEDSIAECAYLNQVGACVLNSGPYRFQYVNSSELGFLGRNSSCPTDNGQLLVINRNVGDTQAACACNFYSSHNKISLFMIESDVDSNRVITGLRFVRKDEVLYIQPREGTLGPNGFINRYSQRWIHIPKNIHSSLIESINRENRVFFLDDLTLPINYVLTGIKFNKVTRGDVTGFAIEILGSLFNYKTGKLLFLGDSRRLLQGSNEKSGKSLSFTSVNSILTKSLHTVTPSDIKYVSLVRSELKEDFGQSTLPLFDAVPIDFKVPSALGGVGIFHKGIEGYAGLISLRVYGINNKEYFNEFKIFHITNEEKMLRGLFLIIFIINICTSSCALEALYEAGQRVWDLYAIIDNRGLDISHEIGATERLSDNPMIRALEGQVHNIHKSLNELEEVMGPKEIWRIIKSWPLDAPTIMGIETIELFVEMIDETYELFDYRRNDDNLSHASFEILMKDVFLSLDGYILVIRKFVTNEDKSVSNEINPVDAIANFAKAHSAEICETPRVISNILIQLLRMIIIAELKTSTMLAYDNIYGYVQNKEKEARQQVNSRARESLEKQFAIYINLFSYNMMVIDKAYNRACDPPGGNWTRDESFYELEKTIQAIVFRYDWRSCRTESCNYINNEKPYRCRPLFYTEPVFKNSEDTVTECAYLSHVQACVLNSGPYQYQFVRSAKLGFLGRDSPCPKDNGEVIETNRTPLVSYTGCACNFYSSHNKISLMMVESNVKHNRVITGLRFVRQNEILWIQPREGTLRRDGYVNQLTQRWIPIPKNVPPPMTAFINKINRVFFLDDLILPEKYVLTGIKFNKVRRGSVSGFAIEIFGTDFDYKTGTLSLKRGSKMSWRELSENSGISLSFTSVSSLFTKLPHTVTTSDTGYVSLERSALKEDFGQSTLPLFDAVPITMNISTALGGVGMFHKGVENYAGFISLRVYGIRYKKYFDDFKLFHLVNDRVLFRKSSHSQKGITTNV